MPIKSSLLVKKFLSIVVQKGGRDYGNGLVVMRVIKKAGTSIGDTRLRVRSMDAFCFTGLVYLQN